MQQQQRIQQTPEMLLEMEIEHVQPHIYLSKNFIIWNKENLRTNGFTHIIIIDKHIQELYYPSPVFKLVADADADAQNEFDTSSAFEYFIHDTAQTTTTTSLNFDKEFQAIHLNFGEKAYLTTVLPNCYRAVRFIHKALQVNGKVIVIDCNGGEQKCLTIVVAYLMYKHNISFSMGFTQLKNFYKKADLDRYYMHQLYEYEPILQVQRAQSCGHSCSRHLHAAILKRKKVEETTTLDETESHVLAHFNPLHEFNANSQVYEQKESHVPAQSHPQHITSPHKKQMRIFHTDDFQMEI